MDKIVMVIVARVITATVLHKATLAVVSRTIGTRKGRRATCATITTGTIAKVNMSTAKTTGAKKKTIRTSF